MPESNKEFIQVQDWRGLVHPDRWSTILYIEDKGEFRHVVENEIQSLTGIVSEENGTFTFTAGPTSAEETETTATGILFNRGSSVQALKAVCASLLALISRLRKSQPHKTKQTKESNHGA